MVPRFVGALLCSALACAIMSAYDPFGAGLESTTGLGRGATGALGCLTLEDVVPFWMAARTGDGRATFPGLSAPSKLGSAFLFGVELVRFSFRGGAEGFRDALLDEAFVIVFEGADGLGAAFSRAGGGGTSPVSIEESTEFKN